MVCEKCSGNGGDPFDGAFYLILFIQEEEESCSPPAARCVQMAGAAGLASALVLPGVGSLKNSNGVHSDGVQRHNCLLSSSFAGRAKNGAILMARGIIFEQGIANYL